MIKGIIFDMDGVMIDSERQSNYGWLRAAEEKGVEMPMWLINIFKGAPAVISKQHFDNYFHGQIDYWDTRKLRSKYVHKLRETEGIPVKRGLYELLEYSRSAGIKCAVATSTQKKSAYETLHVIGVWDYLDAVVFGDEVANGKPAPDIFLKAAENLGLEPSECIVIEDSINGIRAGYNAKMRVVHVPDTIMIDDDIKELTFSICSDLNEVINIIEKCSQNGQMPAGQKAVSKGLDRCALKYAFIAYAAPYNIQDDRIRLKIEHTYRVAALCERIAKSLGLNGPDIDMAWFLGMFHDIGRFEQVKRYGTFDDSKSTDHAVLSADIVFSKESSGTDTQANTKADFSTEIGNGTEYNMSESTVAISQQIKSSLSHIDAGIAELAIRSHNTYRLPDTLSEREKMFCNILRDADKIDILKVCVEEPALAVYAVTEDELRSCSVSDEVMKAFFAGETVLKSIRRTAADKLVGHISLVYELVYPESLIIAKEQGYLDRLLDFSSDNSTAKEQFKLIRAKMEKYLHENINP